MIKFDSTIFKAYDIRGIYGKDFNDDFAYSLGQSIIRYSGPKNVVIGYDSRLSSMKLFYNLAMAITDSGCDVIHIGMVSRPMINWIVARYGYDLGVMVTASHNPKEYNGFKFIGKNGEALHYENYINHLERLIGDKIKIKNKKKGRVKSKDYIDAYVNFLSEHISKDVHKHIKNKGIKIVGDCSNGSSGEIVKRFLEKNNFNYELLFAEPDGNFPNHNPNPQDIGASIFLRNQVIKMGADLGFILDPDADRIRFADEKGQIIDNNYSACIVAKYLLSIDKKKYVVHDLVSRMILGETIRRNKGKEIISRIGFVFMNESMRKYDAVFGAEVSGHYSFRDMYHLDGGLMMLVKMLNAIYSKNNKGKRLSTIVKPLDKYHDTGEVNKKAINHIEKGNLLKKVKDYYYTNKKKYFVKKIITLDGISVIFKYGWLNVRPSNTEPMIRIRAEGKTLKNLEKIKKSLSTIIKI